MTMSKYKLTFSLASLVLIFALAFATVPAMAEEGGPTVTIGQGTSKTRAAFDLTFTFSHPVEAAGSSAQTLAFTWRLVDAQTNLLGTANNATATQTANSRTAYTGQIDIAGNSDNVRAVKVMVSVAENLKTGTTTANSKQNQPGEMTFGLPPVQGDTTVAVTAEPATPATPGKYTVTFTFSADASPAFAVGNISIPASGVALDNFQTVTAETVYSVDAQLVFGVSGIMVGVDPGYAKPTSAGSGSVTLPPPAPKSPVRERAPMVDITISEHNTAERTFRIDIDFTPQAKSDGSDGSKVTVGDDFHMHDAFVVEDNSDRAITLTREDVASGDNSYLAILKYGRLADLPLTISIDPNALDEKYKATAAKPNATPPDPGIPDVDPVTAMVGMTAPVDPGVTEGDPSVAIMTSDHNATARTFRVQVTITPGMKSDGSAGSPIASFGHSDLKITGAGDTAVTITAVDESFMAGTADSPASTYTAILMYNPLAVLPLTVTTADGFDTSDDPPTMAMVPPSGTQPVDPDNNPPVYANASISITGVVGTAIAAADASATDPDGDTLTYSWDVEEAALGLMLDTATGMITGTPLKAHTMAHTVTADDSNGGTATLTVSVAIAAAPTAPGMPTNLSATPNQDMNTIRLTWDAPANPGSTAITGYVVTMNGTAQPAVMTTSYTTARLAAGTYTFTVAAMNSAGTGASSSQVTAIINVDPTPVQPPAPGAPAAPTGLSAMVNADNTVTATWTEPAGNITGYSVSILNLATNRGSRYTVPGQASVFKTPEPLAAGSYSITVQARNAAGLGASASVSVTIAAAPVVPPGLPPTAQIDSTIPLPAATIPANGFVVLQRNPTDSGIYSQVSSVTVGLANLDHLFRDRGGIALHGTGAANDLVFSEIMWGSDSSLADDTHSQWIELYNTTSGALQLSNYRLEFYSARIGATAGAIDEVNSLSWGSLHGQRGRTRGEDTQGRFSEPVEIISMYLKINYSRVERSQARGEQLKDFPNGSAHGHWASSARPSLNIESTWRLATPGAKPRFTIHGASAVRRNVIITEVGNSSNDSYDWIEIYNTTDGVINLKKWELSYVYSEGGVGKEKSLFQFPDNDSHRLPGKSHLVIAASDPKNDGNDLAAGIDIRRKGIDQVGKGLGTWVGGGSGDDKGINALYTVVPSLKLPNGNAKTLIILRHDRGKMGKASHFEDVIGTLSVKLQGPVVSGWTGYDANANVHYNTSLWPLHATGGPHGNVIDGTGDEDFRAGRVIQRNNFGGGTGEKHLAVRGWTGIGYDLTADRNNENGGTPGYSKDSHKSKTGELAGTVSISEIMLATDEDAEGARIPRATRLPQWIEIYNASLTQGVSVNNWYLEIQNTDSEDLETRNLHGTLRLPNVTIPPNQTILIVSNSGLNSGNFPEERTVNLYTNGTYRSILNLRNRGDSVLSQEGFYVQLRDHENNYVDEIGNLGVSRRTGIGRRDNFDQEWEIPSLNTEEGHRTSLIRVYNNKMAEDGLMAESWRRASDTSFRNVPSLTYFGNHRDFGTPGYRGGGPLPVQLSKFRPQRLDSGEVVILWITESELNNAGFNILRTETRDGAFQQVNTELIKGHGTTSERNSYTWTDKTAKPNVVYYYQIQDVSLDGQVQTLRISRLKGNISAEGKVTTTWGSLKLQD